MHDVLLGATQDADTLILSRLNGLNFAQRFMVLGKLLDDLRGQSTHLRRLEREIEEVCVCMYVCVCWMEEDD